MAKNLVRKVFSCDASWVAPAGVTSVRAITVPMVETMNFTLGQTAGIGITNCDAYSWGQNICGEAGTGNLTVTCKPTLVGCSLKWRTISSGVNNNGGITTTGDAYMWGASACGILGNNQIATPACLPSTVCCGFKWKTLAIGANSAFGIICTGDAYAWGSNRCGALGINTITAACQPTIVCCGFKWQFITTAGAGGANSLSGGITTSGDAYMWGDGVCGAIGNNTITTVCQPTLVCCGFKWQFLSIGTNFVGGITCAGALYMWGANASGELGVNSTTSKCQPTLVCCGFKWKWLALGQDTGGNNFTMGLDVCGNAWAWGANTCGQLGINSTTSMCQPTLVCCGFKWKTIAAGTASSGIAGGITTEGVGYVWGDARCGGLGNNTTSVVCQPTQICCGFTWGPLYGQTYQIFAVNPGTTYSVAIFGQFPSFEYQPLTQDYSTQSIILEYFQ